MNSKARVAKITSLPVGSIISWYFYEPIVYIVLSEDGHFMSLNNQHDPGTTKHRIDYEFYDRVYSGYEWTFHDEVPF